MQVLNEVSLVVVEASKICTDIKELDYEHICERTKIAGHRSVLLVRCFHVAFSVHCNIMLSLIFIDRIAGEIIRLVASVCVRPFVCGRFPV